jgi:hypothetical protein
MGAFFLLRMNDHLQYLNRVKATLDGKGDFTGCDHHSCKLGLWMDGVGVAESGELGPEARAVFDSLFEPHRQFHEASSQALRMQAAGDRHGSEDKLTEMHQLSALLVNKLLYLDTLASRKK